MGKRKIFRENGRRSSICPSNSIYMCHEPPSFALSATDLRFTLLYVQTGTHAHTHTLSSYRVSHFKCFIRNCFSKIFQIKLVSLLEASLLSAWFFFSVLLAFGNTFPILFPWDLPGTRHEESQITKYRAVFILFSSQSQNEQKKRYSLTRFLSSMHKTF